MMDMLGMTLKAMGIDPQAIVGQAAALGAAFQNLQDGQRQILANQHAIMAAMGLAVPMPDGEVLAIIELESRKVLEVSAA